MTIFCKSHFDRKVISDVKKEIKIEKSEGTLFLKLNFELKGHKGKRVLSLTANNFIWKEFELSARNAHKETSLEAFFLFR